jgi:hypothetical protein
VTENTPPPFGRKPPVSALRDHKFKQSVFNKTPKWTWAQDLILVLGPYLLCLIATSVLHYCFSWTTTEQFSGPGKFGAPLTVLLFIGVAILAFRSVISFKWIFLPGAVLLSWPLIYLLSLGGASALKAQIERENLNQSFALSAPLSVKMNDSYWAAKLLKYYSFDEIVLPEVAANGAAAGAGVELEPAADDCAVAYPLGGLSGYMPSRSYYAPTNKTRSDDRSCFVSRPYDGHYVPYALEVTQDNRPGLLFNDDRRIFSVINPISGKVLGRAISTSIRPITFPPEVVFDCDLSGATSIGICHFTLNKSRGAKCVGFDQLGQLNLLATSFGLAFRPGRSRTTDDIGGFRGTCEP